MFKKIPGNHNYIVSLNSQLCKSNGTPSDLTITGETMMFPSLEAVMSTFNTSYHIVKSRIENSLPLGDWELKENLTLL
jgi:hypothetical protein